MELQIDLPPYACRNRTNSSWIYDYIGCLCCTYWGRLSSNQKTSDPVKPQTTQNFASMVNECRTISSESKKAFSIFSNTVQNRDRHLPYGQQNGPDCLGGSGEERKIQSGGFAGRVTRSAGCETISACEGEMDQQPIGVLLVWGGSMAFESR